MRKSTAVALVLVTAGILSGCEQCSKSKDEVKPSASATGTPAATDATAPASTTPTAASGDKAAKPDGTLQITDIKVGTGVEATDNKKVSVNYTGTLLDGTVFDTTKNRGTPFTFTLGAGVVISGWDQGVKGMKEGGVRKLVIPPNLAYGNRAVGGVIPPDSTLVFEIELVKVE